MPLFNSLGSQAEVLKNPNQNIPEPLTPQEPFAIQPLPLQAPGPGRWRIRGGGGGGFRQGIQGLGVEVYGYGALGLWGMVRTAGWVICGSEGCRASGTGSDGFGVLSRARGCDGRF